MGLAVSGAVSEGIERLDGRLLPYLIGLFAVTLLVQVGTQSQLAAQPPEVLEEIPFATDAVIGELPLALGVSLGVAWLVWLAGTASFVATSLLTFRALSSRPGGAKTEPARGDEDAVEGTGWETDDVAGGGTETIDASALLGMTLSGVAAAVIGLFAVGIGLVALVFPGIVVATLFAFTHPYIATERLGTLEAMKRSYGLTKGHRLQVFGVLAVTVVSFYAVTTVGAFLTLVFSGAPIAAELVSVAFGAVGWLVALAILAAAFDRLEELKAEQEAKWEGIDDELLP